MQSESRLQAAVFDLDGTLIGTRRLYLECYRRAVADVLGRSMTDAELLAHRPRSEVRLLLELTGESNRERVLDAFYRHYEALHPELYEGVFPGIHEMLAELRRDGVRLGIVTGKSRRAWEITRVHATFPECEVVILDDDVAEPKPNPQGIRMALERLGVEPARTIYVGDTISDVHAATAAGTRAGAVLWSHTPEDRPRVRERAAALGAAIFESPTEIVAAVRGAAPREAEA